MAAPRRVIEIAIGEEDLARLESIARSRTEPACRVERARILLAYRAEPSAYAVAEAIGVTHHAVLRCLHRAVRLGAMAALDDSPRPGKAPEITDEARAWLVSLACHKAKDLGYPHELWTTRLLARHARDNAVAAGHSCMASIVQGTVCKILARHEVKPHKVRYYLERRDEDFEAKMADVSVSTARSRSYGRAKPTRRTSQSFRTTRSRASRRSATPHPTCRRNRDRTRPSRVITNTSATARSACSPGSTCSPARCTRASKIAIGRVSSSASSSGSTPLIPPTRRSS